MIRTRHWLVVALAFAIAGAACKKDDDNKSGQPAADKTSEKTDKAPANDKAPAKTDTPAPAAPAMPVKAITGQIADDLSLLPVDSEAVFGINFEQIKGSGLWKQFVAPRLTGANIAPIEKFKAVCDFDPLADLKSVAIGVKGLGGNDGQGAVVIHGYDRKKANACFDKNTGNCEKDGAKCKVDGDVAFVTTKDNKKFAFTFVNDNTALMVFGPDAESKDKVKAVASGQTALKTSAAFVDLYNRLNTQESVWMIMNGNSAVFQKTPLPFKLKAVFGTFNITDGLTIDLRMRLGSPDEATNTVSTYKGQLANPQLKPMFTKLDMTSDGPDVKVAVAMTSQQLQQLAQLVGGMVGSMMMGGGGGMGGP